MSTKKKRSAAMRALEQIVGPMTFGSCLSSIRLCEEESQTSFAEKLGISKSHLCDIEAGRKAASPARAARFAELLGYPEDFFVRLALQMMVDEAGLRFNVKVEAA